MKLVKNKKISIIKLRLTNTPKRLRHNGFQLPFGDLNRLI